MQAQRLADTIQLAGEGYERRPIVQRADCSLVSKFKLFKTLHLTGNVGRLGRRAMAVHY